mgnify:CR=1 FL=1
MKLDVKKIMYRVKFGTEVWTLLKTGSKEKYLLKNTFFKRRTSHHFN